MLFKFSKFTFFHSSQILKTENNVTVPLNQNLQKLPEPFLELWERFPYQHQFLSQLPVHPKQLLTPNREENM